MKISANTVIPNLCGVLLIFLMVGVSPSMILMPVVF